MGVLSGLKIVELAGIGPAPMAATLLADLGAEVLRVERLEPSGLGVPTPSRYKLLHRSRHAVAVDLKNKQGTELALRLIDKADALIEGFRPGVMERLGLGPEPCLARNPRLVYGRMTGWGQTGPLAPTAGHDLDYIALAGALHAIGRAGQKPTPPLNLVGDFGGGALFLAMGMLAALWEAGRSGKGQVVDAAMIEGAAFLMLPFWGMFASGQHTTERGTNFLDSGAHFYEVYECADGKFLAVAPIEEKFYAELLRRLEIDPKSLPPQHDRAHWAELKEKFAAKFKTKSRDDWAALFAGGDACVTPVLSMAEAPDHPQAQARGNFVSLDGIKQPAPAPRFSRTPSAAPTAPEEPGPEGRASLKNWGLNAAEIETLTAARVLG